MTAGQGETINAHPSASASGTGEAGETLNEEELGQRLRTLRKERGLSLASVASAARLSIGLISQIERGQTSPSFRSLRLLSGALGVPIETFFTQAAPVDPAERGIVVHPRNRRVLNLSKKGIVTEYVDPDTDGTMQMMLLTIEPGGGTGQEFDQHVGEEGGLVLAGQFELLLSGRTLVLNEGDSFRFRSETPHSFRNPGQIPTRVIWFITPTLYGRGGLARTI
ncbi:helix-turn-helix domain-containing protein [Marinivivus vitaminiproducens]|uniref:helix-turn-helix domain-containing protein n=1 Tax=Marinivivus vitaminiproducens TaxID=3035935 RepID=UPI0027A74A65|nr:XRE family transcriptional regulator [Geminicoccaceae bacterium SCSIO 64248]